MITNKSAAQIRWLWVAAATFALAFSVAAQPRITALTWAEDGTSRIYHVNAEVTAGLNYRLQASTDLTTNSWIEVGSATATDASLKIDVTNAVATDPAYRYFRLVAESGAVAPGGMALIPAGSFQMGDALGDWPPSWGAANPEIPVHSVFVSDFYMDKTEVTKALWDEVRNWSTGNGYDLNNVGAGKAANHPVHTVNWYDVVKWCNARSQKDGRVPAYYRDAALTLVYKTGQVAPYVKWSAGYRLPTEAEWEKAARGGASGHRFPWSDADTITHSRANYGSDSGSAYDVSPTREYHPTYAVGSQPYTSPVGSFAPNGYGLFDMAGNVWEWCWDWHGAYSSGSQSDPRGPGSGPARVVRGGGWDNGAFSCRSAFRGGNGPVYRNFHGGFRSVLPPGQ